MFLKQEFNLIIAIVHRGFSDPVINVAKSAGAEGATILNGRGTSIHETDVVMGVQIQPEKEVLLILVKKQLRRRIIRAITLSSGLGSEGHGLCFSIPVDEVGGITHLMQSLAPLKKIVKPKKSILPPTIKAKQKIADVEKEKTTPQKVVIKKNPAKKAVKTKQKTEVKTVEDKQIEAKK